MNTFKNLLIALLTGLLALMLSTQTSNGATVKTYDAVKLAQYTMCLNANANWSIAGMHVNGGNGRLSPMEIIAGCKIFLP
jgi:hypothetical protein